MGVDDFKGITLTPKTVTYITGLLGLAFIFYNGVQSYSEQQFAIKRLDERDAMRGAQISRLASKVDAQTNTITELKIAINRLADQLERNTNDK